MPVPVNSPFRRALLAASAPEGTEVFAHALGFATMVKLSIGAFVTDPAWKLIPLGVEFPNVYRVWPPGPAVDAQRVLTLSWPILPPVSVLDYAVVAWACCTARSTAIAVVSGLLSSCAANGSAHEEQADAAALEMRISRTPSQLEIS